MMSEISFSSALDVSTPLASSKSRRISILPISHADLSSPTTAQKQLKMLELENLALSEDLDESEAHRRALEAELTTLRSQLSASSSPSTSASSASSSALPSSSSYDSLDAVQLQQYSAEVKAARRLINRLAAHIASYDPSSSTLPTSDETDALFTLDQSIVHDPERSIVAPSSTHLTTPNGKTKVSRGFGTDLLDDIDVLRNVLEENARKASFSAIEQTVALQSVTAQNERLAARVQQLQIELEGAQSSAAPIEQLQASLHEAEQRETQLKEQCETSQRLVDTLRSDLNETAAKLDQVTAEQELTISAAAAKSAAQIEALQLELQERSSSDRVTELEQQLEHVQTELLHSRAHTAAAETNVESDASGRVAQLEAQLDEVKTESAARVAAVEAQLEARKGKTSDVQTILAELSAKRERLHAIQLHTSQIGSLQRTLQLQQRIVDLLERVPATDAWMVHAQQLSASLAELKSAPLPSAPIVERAEVSTMTTLRERVEAEVMTDTTPTPVEEVAPVQQTAEKEDAGELISSLRGEIAELEARVLRRNEQIGSLQRQLKNTENDLARTRTNQMLAEETVADLDTEKLDHLNQIHSLQSQLDAVHTDTEQLREMQTALASAQSDVVSLRTQLDALTESNTQLESHNRQLDTQAQALQQQLTDLTAIPPTEKAEAGTQTEGPSVAELSASLQAATERVGVLDAEVLSLTQRYASLQGEKVELDAQIVSLRSTLSASADTAALVETQEAELSALKSALRKSEDRLASTQLELDSVQLALAEHRERASSDAERLDLVQSQLSALRTERDALSLSSATDRAALEESRAAIAALQQSADEAQSALAESRAHSEAKALVEAELSELKAKHAELETVLAERDAAMTTRNTEYWTLKEELAELQELAERSTSPSSLAELQSELEASHRAHAALQDRVAAQETALLKLKTDLTAARSTEDMLNEQYSAAQRRIALLESSSPSHEVEEVKAKLAAAEAEAEYLSTRLSELEDELGRKADEIEEADSKILDALKEAKKYATRYTKLAARYETLQTQLAQEEEERKKAQAELLLQQQPSAPTSLPRGEGSAEGVASVAGRKRSKPDTADALPDEVRKTTPVKAVYAPSPSHKTPSASFTPIRRSALKSASRSHKPSQHTPIVLGLGTPSTTTDAPAPGLVRSSSNPSELIALRLTSPPKPQHQPQLLGDKTNLAPSTTGTGSGTSRLSSKLADREMKSLKRTPTSLLPDETRTPTAPLGEKKRTASAPHGAADFLARMKAQRASNRA